MINNVTTTLLFASVETLFPSRWYSDIYYLLFGDQGLWFGNDSPLWMLPNMSSDLLGVLSQKGFDNVQQLVNLSKSQLQTVFKSVPTSAIFQVLSQSSV